MPYDNDAGSGRPAGVGGTGKSVSFRGQAPLPATTDHTPMPSGGAHRSPTAPGGKYPDPGSSPGPKRR